LVFKQCPPQFAKELLLDFWLEKLTTTNLNIVVLARPLGAREKAFFHVPPRIVVVGIDVRNAHDRFFT